MPKLSPADIYTVALLAGFPPDTAVKMVAIALKESSGNSDAHNTVAPDDSYGLWQINMYGQLGPARIAAWGLAAASDLFDPDVNARAAFSLWAGDDANLARNWYIDRGEDAIRYQSFLPIAQQAAAVVAAGGSPPPVFETPRITGGGGSTATGFPSGRPGAPAPARPASPPASGTGGLGSHQGQSSSPAPSPGSSSLTLSTNGASRWWYLLHAAGAIGWGALVHFYPWLSVPVAIGAPILHGLLPTPVRVDTRPPWQQFKP